MSAKAPNKSVEDEKGGARSGKAQEKLPLPAAESRGMSRKMSHYFLLLVLLIIAAVFFNMVKIFLMPVFLAAVFVGLIFPLYEKMLVWTRERRGLSAFLCVLIFMLLMLVPTYFVADMLRKEVVGIYQNNEQTVQKFIKDIDSGLLDKLSANPWLQKLDIDLRNIDLMSSAKEAVRGVGNLLILLINKTWTGTFQFVMQLFIMFFTMYYFFKDGAALTERIKYLSPLNDEHEEMLISRFVAMSRATVKGTLMIGLAQGSFGAFLLWIFGFGSPIVAGVVMFFLSIIPMVGAWIVLYPAGIYLLIMGQIWQGIVLIAVTAVVIANIDNLLRPRLVGRETGMHDLLIFFSTIGGMSVFGVMGFIVGPVIAALFLTVLEIYSIEFKELLDRASNLSSREVQPPPAQEA